MINMTLIVEPVGEIWKKTLPGMQKNPIKRKKKSKQNYDFGFKSNL